VDGYEKSLFLWSGGSEKNRLFTADIQNDARCAPLIDANF